MKINVHICLQIYMGILMFLIVKSGLKYLINDYIDSGSRPFSRRLQYLLQQLEAIYNKMVKKLQRLCELMRPPYIDLNASLEK